MMDPMHGLFLAVAIVLAALAIYLDYRLRDEQATAKADSGEHLLTRQSLAKMTLRAADLADSLAEAEETIGRLSEESAEWERQCEAHRVKSTEIDQWRKRLHEAEQNVANAVNGRMAAEQALADAQRRHAEDLALEANRRRDIEAERDGLRSTVTSAKQALCGFPAEEGADEGTATPEEVRKTWGWQQKDADERKLTGARRS